VILNNMNFQDLKFEIGFWHPFGPHAGESTEDILKRKQEEIEKNNWTLWSFSYRTRDTLNSWYKEIAAKNPSSVLVFCSENMGDDTKSKPSYCNYYIPVGKTEPVEIPSVIDIPHPMGKKTRGSAFIVKKIIYPVPNNYGEILAGWFYSGQKKWQNHRSSTRGEHLIRSGGIKPISKFCAILELQAPYLAEGGISKSFPTHMPRRSRFRNYLKHL